MFMVNVGKYPIHGSCGVYFQKQSSQVHMSSWSSRNCHRDLLAHTRSMYGNVWYIYLELPLKSTIHVGKYTCPMDPMGMINLSISLKDSPRVLPKHWFTVVSRWKKQVPFIEITVWIDYLRNLQYLAVNQAFGSPQPIASLKLWMNWLFTNCYRVWATPPRYTSKFPPAPHQKLLPQLLALWHPLYDLSRKLSLFFAEMFSLLCNNSDLILSIVCICVYNI